MANEPKVPAVAEGSKPKTAKELKKEKRAAAVAARGGDQRPPESHKPQPGQPSSSTSKLQTQSTSNAGPSTSATSAPAPPIQSIPSIIKIPNVQSHEVSSSSKSSYVSENLFYSHIPAQRPTDTSIACKTSKIHPSVIEVGVAMSSGSLRGSNSRTMAMMGAFQDVITDYECPEQAVLWKDLPNHLSPMIAWLEECRPKGVGGGNAIRWMKGEINKLGEGDMRSESEQKDHLVRAIGNYIRDKIEYADHLIVENAQEKIRPGNTIVTFARSSVVEKVLLETWEMMQSEEPAISFNVIVVDSRPLNEGRNLMTSLSSAGIPCTYTLLPLLSSVLPQADIVLLGASALHSDGALYSRAGTASVAMLAKEFRVPVVACVETYKFGERVVLDGVASNELGDPLDVLNVPHNPKGGAKGSGPRCLTPLSLMYDLTPPNLITTVCTELGFIPPSSVPTVLGKAQNVV